MRTPLIMIVLTWFCQTVLNAQATRFNGNYPLSIPSNAVNELQTDFNKTLTAVMGGAQLASHENTPTNREDPEMFTRQDYKQTMDAMLDYALSLLKEMEDDEDAGAVKKIAKLIKSDKFDDAIELLKETGAETNINAQQLYFIWKDYLLDKQQNAPWLNPQNEDVARAYRAILAYVSKNYERPYGLYADMGAIVSDAAQALSDGMEDAANSVWKGSAKDIQIKAENPIRRLISNVAYIEWRLHDPTNGRRGAGITQELWQHLKLTLYSVVESMVRDGANWNKAGIHGSNLQQLYADAKQAGWKVDGDKARKKSDQTPASSPNPSSWQNY